MLQSGSPSYQCLQQGVIDCSPEKISELRLCGPHKLIIEELVFRAIFV